MANSESRALPLPDLAIFVAVAEAQGFSAAARRLGLSKAMISVAVSRLEERLGVQLFQRTTRRLSLTEAATATLPHAQRALLAARDAEEAARQNLTTPRGVLRVNAAMSFGLLHVVPALGAFARAFPEVRVDLALDDRVLDLIDGGFDVALRIGALPDSSLIGQHLGRSQNVIVAHVDYLTRAGAPLAPADLSRHAVLLYSLAVGGSRWVLHRGGRSRSVHVSGPLQVNSSLALRQALLQGLGIARLPLFIAGEDLAAGRLVRVLPAWSLPDQPIHALTTARDHVARKTRAFIEFVRARIGAEPYWERGLPPPVT